MDLGLLSGTAVLIDGNTSWKQAAEDALATWNLYLYTVKFKVYTQSPKSPAYGDSINQVFFSDNVYGQSFDEYTLALTKSWSIGTLRKEADTIFNTHKLWNSYRGPLLRVSSGATLNDFHRVAMHEFGHTLGLDHPNAYGQNVVAQMNTPIFDLDGLAQDDINGAKALYSAAPPGILTQPMDQIASAGTPVTFSVSAYGVPAPTYQWYFSGIAIQGATSSSYTVIAQPSFVGPYQVVLRNSLGSVTSRAAVLTIGIPPAITAQPQSRNVLLGNGATLSVSVSSVTPPAYQWYRNSFPISGATAATYAIGAAQLSDAGNYVVKISNFFGAVDSSVATLTVEYPPVINTQPQSQTVSIGATATFAVVASGIPAPTYQWRFNGANISGATTSGYTRSSAQPAQAGNYTVTATNTRGSVTSMVAALTVVLQPRALSVVNPGFEDPVLGDGAQSSGSGYNVPGWVEFDEEWPWAWCVYNPDAANLAAQAHEGQNVLYSLGYRPVTQYVEQQLGDTFQPNTHYTLSAWVADPDARALHNNVRLMLFANSTLLGSATIQPTAAATWTHGSLMIETGDSHPQLGQLLKIRIMWGDNASYRVFVDDVSLTAIPAVQLSGSAVPGNGLMGLTISGPTGLNYSVLSSTNLSLPIISWTIVTNGTITASPFTLNATVPATIPQRFYRAALRP